jgi:DNA-directed RNA polymerase subunit RPC12/RpoP
MNCNHKVLIRFSDDLYVCTCCDEEFDINQIFTDEV